MDFQLTEEIIYSTSSNKGVQGEIIDADWKDDCGIAVIFLKNNKTSVHINGITSDISFTSLNLAFVRWIDRLHILLATHENKDGKNNIFIIDLNSALLHSFNGGEGIEDLTIGKEGIWISYYDQGVLGSGISTEGLVLFDEVGKIIFRYRSDLKDRPEIIDCYAICKGKSSTIWLFPYTVFLLIEVNPIKRVSFSYPVPETLHGSHALCIRGQYAYFFAPYESNQKLYSLKLDKKKSKEIQFLGTLPGIARGLNPSQNNHFISITGEEVKLHRVLNEDEYDYS